MTSKSEKLIIYQLFPRILTNDNDKCVHDGTLEQNGTGKMNDYTPRLLRSIRDLGVNCVWYTGIIEHATKCDFTSIGIPKDNPYIVKGEAGSPYAIKDYYDVNPYLATNPERRFEEYLALVERTHAEGLRMIIDFVPNHTARVYRSDAKPKGVKDFGDDDDVSKFFSRDNNYYYITNQQFSPSIPLGNGKDAYVEFPAKATGNDCFNAFCGQNDWYETVKLNYGHDYGDGSDHFDPVPDTWRKMLDILLHWAATGVDGFRCDMVFMVPLAFWHWVIPKVKKRYPQIIFIGEIYDVAMYRPFLDYGCFDYLYDKVNLYDTLVGIETRNVSAASLTGCWQTVDGIGDRMLNFLENHDEVRFASKSYAGDPSLVLPSLVVSAMISKGPFMIYYGQELGERASENEGFAGYNDRTTIFDFWSYDTMRRWHDGGRCTTRLLTEGERWLRQTYSRVLHLCNECSAIREGGFFDLMYANIRNEHFDPHKTFAFIRHSDRQKLLIITNFNRADIHCGLIIPDHAVDMCGLPTGEVEAVDLISGDHLRLSIEAGKPVELSLKSSSALVLELNID